ncbi:transcriptional regulator with GAF, ATPase, and Fis domain [Flavobacterium sp. 90]|uniref:sigma-54 interaction domain-containing protein n=1 Tax=unclassified Flavobacterium TaxID=196869 RepID=UPI000EAE9FB5|nr:MULTISPECIES: sigma 54-interacting transcriptional regulator [unclassified Flavobacterium]RKR05022.1 transcriptional regulator with GAF, ATPase, and Fis domain [Flavobacterium sp. 81]TCK56338.1 transcriptional regulator with GAF, ATPase, and Fis domain [Flavobacterium sp. 90]
MDKPNDQTAIIMKRLQEREKEQMLILSICSALSQALTKEELDIVVSNRLKEEFSFDDFILASADEKETEYHIFYHYLQKETAIKKYLINDGFFDLCLDSPDTVIFDLKTLDEKKNNFPDYISTVNNKGLKNGIGICLPYIKGNRNVLFLFFKNPNIFSRESNRIIRGIGMQLSITLRNIILSQEYESKISAIKSLNIKTVEKEEEPITISSEGFYGIVGNSNAMQNVYELISQVAASQSTVLISGETGTGKELVASAIHNLSLASNKKMIKVNCASIPENLIESELFGHEKGAFTGALESRIGKFEQAENSTIFLDEIGEMPLELQGKLLRVLQEKELERIGSNKIIKVNVRVIAATNRTLEKEVAEGRFRSDLYYRLNVFPIALPSLRERPEDIELLGNFFLEKHAAKIGKKVKGFSQKVLKSMVANEWPGNVRELENIVERSILFAKEEVIKEMSFPKLFKTETTSETDFHIKTLQEIEKEHILKVVKKCNGRISGPQGAAVLLGLPSTTLMSRMQKLGIKKEHSAK